MLVWSLPAMSAHEKTLPRQSAASGQPALPTVRVVYTCGLAVQREPQLLKGGTVPVGRTTEGQRAGLVLDDARTSRKHAEFVVTGSADKLTTTVRDLGSSNGTFVNGKWVTEHILNDGDVIRVGDTLMVYRRVRDSADAPISAIKGTAPAIRQLRCAVELFASTDATVILQGETGTGKEVVARELHALSGRPGPFVPVNCSAIPEALAESVLFGHVAGAFTDAKGERTGYFEAANQGTLFLDELGDLPPVVQPKLLRALEERAVVRVGSHQEVPIDVRIICATESRLDREAESQSFRGALYARLAEVTVTLPPLRARREDVLLLLAHFLDSPMKLDPQLAEALLVYDWPYNVRELKKITRELQLRARGADNLDYDMIKHRLPGVAFDASPIPHRQATTSDDPATTQRIFVQTTIPTPDELVTMLKEYDGNISHVARLTGRSRRQVYRWLTDYDISLDDYRVD